MKKTEGIIGGVSRESSGHTPEALRHYSCARKTVSKLKRKLKRKFTHEEH
jgi:hypothetical protein